MITNDRVLLVITENLFVMQVLLKLFDMENPAADGSRIPRDSVQRYLASDDYREVIANHLALGGYTHKSRQVDGRYENVISPDDQIVVDENITHYIKKIFIKDGDPFCYAIIELLNPDEYSGRRKDNILNLMADLKSGIMLPCSVVISASWSYSNVAEYIKRIKGVDFTLGPSFEGSGTVKVFSKIEKSGEYDRTYSFTNPTEVVSAEGASVVKELSLEEIGKKFGLNSNQYITKKYSGTNLSNFMLTRSTLKTNPMTQNQELFDRIKNILDPQFEGSKEVLDDLITNHRGEIVQSLMEVPGTLGDMNDEVLSLKLNEFLRSTPKLATFSSVNSVRDRMIFNNYPRYQLINRLLKSYKKYSESHKNLNEKDKKWLDVLFLQDILILIRNVAGKIKKGSTMTSLYALSQFGQEVANEGREFSKVYRQVIISDQVMKFIPPMKYNLWKKELYEFINSLSRWTFNRDTTLNILEIDSLIK